jgi:hypothetical protein
LIQEKCELKIDWATHEAAKYACENWHYSKSVPKSKLVKLGAWENGKFIGVVIFSYGATAQIGSPYGLLQNQVCELTRIALTKHRSFVSKIMAISIKKLKQSNMGLRLIVSFADTEQGHHGGIYQATNWVYNGKTNACDEYVYKGKRWHGRAFRSSLGSHLNYIDKGLEIISGSQKHRYLMPLDKEMRKQIELLRKPYPKRLGSIDSDAVIFPDDKGRCESDLEAPILSPYKKGKP